jgi:hypothetical protein
LLKIARQVAACLAQTRRQISSREEDRGSLALPEHGIRLAANNALGNAGMASR